MKFPFGLISAVFLGPLAWFVNLEASFALAPRACQDGAKAPLYAASLLALLLTVIAGSISVTRYQQPDRNAIGEPDPMAASRRRLAFAGIGLSALCLALILAQAIPNVLMGGCE
jgi:hypothetical protein